MLSIIFLLLSGLLILAYLLYQHKKRIHVLEETLQELTEVQEIKTIKANLKGRDQERARIAKDWHDGIGNSLSTLRLVLDTIQAENQERHTEALSLLEHTQREFRYIIDNELVNDFANQATIVNVLERWKRQLRLGNIDFEFNVYNLNKYNNCTLEFKLHLYRMVQELLTNSLKHAQANQMELSLKEEENLLVVNFRDNGIGMSAELIAEKGLDSIKNRLQVLGGAIGIDSKKAEWAEIKLSIPLN